MGRRPMMQKSLNRMPQANVKTSKDVMKYAWYTTVEGLLEAEVHKTRSIYENQSVLSMRDAH